MENSDRDDLRAVRGVFWWALAGAVLWGALAFAVAHGWRL